MEPSHLALFWVGVIACAILIYVILDGFDLGGGVLFGTTRDEAHRVQMLDTIARFWDGNETWLMVTAAALYGAFQDAYAVFLGAFYFPVLLLLFGLIFRGKGGHSLLALFETTNIADLGACPSISRILLAKDERVRF
jgi:cytochrome d ubiquinol oxidase subunit II